MLEHILSTLGSLTFVQPDAAEILFADPQNQSLIVAYSTNNADIGVRVDIGRACAERLFARARLS